MGRLWRIDGTVDTDVLAPGPYMKAPIEELAGHCLETLRPEFATSAKQGDVLLAGPAMGTGSSREQAPEVLKFLGIVAVVAPSFAGIFHRNAINLGLPVFTLDASDLARPELVDGAEVVFDFETPSLNLPAANIRIALDPLPGFLRDLILDGGLVPHLEKRFAGQAARGEG